MTRSDYPVSSVETTFRIVEALDELGEAGISEIAAVANASNSTVHKHLNTLRSLGYVRKDGTTYALSLRFLGLGTRARSQYEIVRAATPAIDELSRTAEAPAALVVLEDGYGVYAYRSPDPVTTDESLPAVGERIYVHTTAAGKAILSALDWSEVRRIIDEVDRLEGMEKTVGSNPERDRAHRSVQDGASNRRGRTIFQLRRKLRAIQDRGFAVERDENRSSVPYVAAPVATDSGPVAAVSVASGRSEPNGERLEEERADLVMTAAAEIEAELARQ